MRKVLIIDTCLICVWLQVPGMEICGSDNDRWDYERVDNKIQQEIAKSTTLVLPLATVIETGNHIAQARAKKYETAVAFAKIMSCAADETSPWAAFSDQIVLWEATALKDLATKYPTLAAQRTSMGDASIVELGWHYYHKGYQVEFLTADEQLKAQQPPLPTPPSRRSSRRLNNP
jgi:hypothetical protein